MLTVSHVERSSKPGGGVLIVEQIMGVDDEVDPLLLLSRHFLQESKRRVLSACFHAHPPKLPGNTETLSCIHGLCYKCISQEVSWVKKSKGKAPKWMLQVPKAQLISSLRIKADGSRIL